MYSLLNKILAPILLALVIIPSAFSKDFQNKEQAIQALGDPASTNYDLRDSLSYLNLMSNFDAEPDEAMEHALVQFLKTKELPAQNIQFIVSVLYQIKAGSTEAQEVLAKIYLQKNHADIDDDRAIRDIRPIFVQVSDHGKVAESVEKALLNQVLSAEPIVSEHAAKLLASIAKGQSRLQAETVQKLAQKMAPLPRGSRPGIAEALFYSYYSGGVLQHKAMMNHGFEIIEKIKQAKFTADEVIAATDVARRMISEASTVEELTRMMDTALNWSRWVSIRVRHTAVHILGEGLLTLLRKNEYTDFPVQYLHVLSGSVQNPMRSGPPEINLRLKIYGYVAKISNFIFYWNSKPVFPRSPFALHARKKLLEELKDFLTVVLQNEPEEKLQRMVRKILMKHYQPITDVQVCTWALDHVPMPPTNAPQGSDIN